MAPTIPKSGLAKASTHTNKAKRVVVARPPVPRSRVAIKKPTTKFTKKGAIGAGSSSNDTCEVVKMLTGTLYLYRGAQQRRVEFVRKF